MSRWLGILRKWEKRANCVRHHDGVAMAIVICVGALLLAFSLAMAYTGSLMMASANTRMDEERCYQLAKSFAQVLEEDLTTGDFSTSSSDSFYSFVAKKFIPRSFYLDYDMDHEDTTVYEYTLASETLPENYGSVSVKMYKESNEVEEQKLTQDSGTESVDKAHAYTGQIKSLEDKTWSRYDLVVKVTATYGDCEYTYQTEYRCDEQSMLNLTAKETNGTETDLYYKRGEYVICTNADCTTPYEGSGEIYYSYRTDDAGVISRTFTVPDGLKDKSTDDTE